MFIALQRALSKHSSGIVRLSTTTAKGRTQSQCLTSYNNNDLLFNGLRTYLSATPVYQMQLKTVQVPSMGDSITEGTIVDLPVAPGDYIKADDVVVILETDKVSIDVRAPEAGSIVEIMGEVDDVVEVGSDLFSVDTDTAGGGDRNESKTKEYSPIVEVTIPAAVPTEIKKPALITVPVLPPTETVAETQEFPNASAFLGRRTERRTKMSRMRQRVAARLKDAQNTAAMLTTFQEVDMSKLMEMRSNYKEVFNGKHGVKLGFMSSFVKASTAALKELPAVNAYIDDATQEIVYREYCDISVAVASPGGGLVVPVLRNTETMTFADVERSIAMYGQKAKDGTLSLDDMAGGTFTISNGGVFGSLMSTPIINPPQSAILGMHATKLRAVADNKGEVVARPMMYMALTYDHRLIDGREAVTFLKSIADKIADPSHLLLDI